MNWKMLGSNVLLAALVCVISARSVGQLFAQDLPYKSHLPIIAMNESSTAVPTATVVSTNPNCANPATVWGWATVQRWTRESVGCGWKLAEGSLVTITVPNQHKLTSPYGTFCAGVTVTVPAATLWKMAPNEPQCVSDATPTATAMPTATSTSVPPTLISTSTAAVQVTATNTSVPAPVTGTSVPATSTSIPATNTPIPSTPTATNMPWIWTQTLRPVDAGVSIQPNSCEAGLSMCWNANTQNNDTPVEMDVFCQTDGAYIQNGVEKYTIPAGRHMVVAFTARQCSGGVVIPTNTAVTATNTSVPVVSTNTPVPLTPTNTPVPWQWTDSITTLNAVDLERVKPIACSDGEPNCYVWSVYQEQGRNPVAMKAMCQLDGEFIDPDTSQYHSPITPGDHALITAFTARPCP